MRTNKEIDAMVNRILQESIESKLDEITGKIKGKMEEYGGAPNISNQPSNMTEKLHGKQKNIDVAKPKGKITKADFDMLRKKKRNMDEMDAMEGNEFTKKLSDARKAGKKHFTVGGKKYPVEESSINEKWKGDVEVESSGEYSNMTIEELDAAIKKLKSKNDKTKEAGKKVSQADRTKMSQLYFAKRAKQGWKGKGKAKVSESAKTYVFNEEQMINIIERIINEQKKPKGLAVTDKVLKADKKENTKALKDVTKKMKDYLKNMSKGNYETNPTHFPKGNGELAKMSKKAYTPSDAVEEYIENFAYSPGMENLQYDEIAPNEEWMEKTIEGSSMTGNNPKWANAVDTGLGKKINKKRKLNLYGQEKNRSYNRVKQPVDISGETKGAKKLDNMFKKLNSESTEAPELKKLTEEFDKMHNLITYDKKTQ